VGVPAAKIGVVVNSPSLARFDATAHPRRGFREDGRLRLVYAGALTPTYELDVAIAAVARIAESRPDLDVTLDLYGRGDSEPALVAQVARLGIVDRVVFHGRIPIEEVPAAIARADIGVAPTRRDLFTDMSLSTKVFEYAAMGKPVVASRLPMIERMFPAGTVAAYPAGDAAAMTEAILAFADDPIAREAAVGRLSRTGPAAHPGLTSGSLREHDVDQALSRP
jgi:glycosyltransferase involved in cell wall biosynthesis